MDAASVTASTIERMGRCNRIIQPSSGKLLEDRRRGGVMDWKLEVVVVPVSDVDRAKAVWMRDNEVDEHYDSIFRELLTYMMGDPRTIM